MTNFIIEEQQLKAYDTPHFCIYQLKYLQFRREEETRDRDKTDGVHSEEVVWHFYH